MGFLIFLIFKKTNLGVEKIISKVEFSAEPGKQMIIVTQIFDAPRELVWKIYTIQN